MKLRSELWQLLITESDSSLPEEQEPELGGVAGVAEEEVEGVEIPGVELDMDRPAAHHSNQVAQEERQQEGVHTSGRLRYGHLLLLLPEYLDVPEVGQADGGEGEDDGEAGPEEEVHQDGVEGGQGEEGAEEDDHSGQGEVGPPSEGPSGVYKGMGIRPAYSLAICCFFTYFCLYFTVVVISLLLVVII